MFYIITGQDLQARQKSEKVAVILNLLHHAVAQNELGSKAVAISWVVSRDVLDNVHCTVTSSSVNVSFNTM